MATKITGGKRLARFLRSQKKAAQYEPKIEIGFKGQIVPLAALLEFGNPATNLPERPAFRQAIPRIAAAVKDYMRGNVLQPDGTIGLTKAKARELAVLIRDELRTSYLDYYGPGLSRRQQARKRGTQYERDELIGHEGPKLIEHIQAYVDGELVD